MPRDLGGVSTTCVSGNRQINLSEDSIASELVPIPLGHSQGKPGACWPRQIPTDENGFVEIQTSQGEIPERKKIQVWMWLRGYEELCQHCPSPHITSPGLNNPGALSSKREKESGKLVPSYPHCERNPLNSAAPQVLRWDLHDWREGRDQERGR